MFNPAKTYNFWLGLGCTIAGSVLLATGVGAVFAVPLISFGVSQISHSVVRTTTNKAVGAIFAGLELVSFLVAAVTGTAAIVGIPTTSILSVPSFSSAVANLSTHSTAIFYGVASALCLVAGLVMISLDTNIRDIFSGQRAAAKKANVRVVRPSISSLFERLLEPVNEKSFKTYEADVAALKSSESAALKNLGQAIEAVAENYDLICPLTQDLMRDPVSLPSGETSKPLHYFDKSTTLESWLGKKLENPLNRHTVTADQVTYAPKKRDEVHAHIQVTRELAQAIKRGENLLTVMPSYIDAKQASTVGPIETAFLRLKSQIELVAAEQKILNTVKSTEAATKVPVSKVRTSRQAVDSSQSSRSHFSFWSCSKGKTPKKQLKAQPVTNNTASQKRCFANPR